jgi:hypothetical protein
MKKVHKGRFWNVVLLLFLLLIFFSTLAFLFRSVAQIDFQVLAIITLAGLAITLFQKQVISLSIDDASTISIEEYRPFFIKKHKIEIDKASVKFKKEHTARGHFAMVIRITNIDDNREFKISEQLFWWDNSSIIQIISDFSQLHIPVEPASES